MWVMAVNLLKNRKVRPPLSAVGKKHGRIPALKVLSVRCTENMGGTAEKLCFVPCGTEFFYFINNHKKEINYD